PVFRADSIVPTGDASAALAGRIVLEHILSTAEGGRDPVEEFDLESLDEVELDARRSDIAPEAVQAWLERWRRAQWPRSNPNIDALMTIPPAACVTSTLALRKQPRLSVRHRRHWTDP